MLARVLWRIERSVAAVAADAESAGMDVGPSDVDADVTEEAGATMFSDWRTAREERRPATVEAKAWIES